MSAPRVFVVTGANKGIGNSIVKLLLQDKEVKIVYLTSRNVQLGEKATKEFTDNGLYPKYHQLDITDKNSIEVLRDHLVKEHDGFDVLVNNAGISSNSYKLTAEQSVAINTCNYFGTLQTCEILLPHMRRNGRVVNVSSMFSQVAYTWISNDWKSKFTNPELTITELTGFMSQYNADANEGKPTAIAYGVSKIGVTLMAIIQQKSMDKTDKNIVVNACCPGVVNTDMTAGIWDDALHPDEGAETPTFLALLPQDTDIRGRFVRYCKVCEYPPTSSDDLKRLEEEFTEIVNTYRKKMIKN